MTISYNPRKLDRAENIIYQITEINLVGSSVCIRKDYQTHTIIQKIFTFVSTSQKIYWTHRNPHPNPQTHTNFDRIFTHKVLVC